MKVLLVYVTFLLDTKAPNSLRANISVSNSLDLGYIIADILSCVIVFWQDDDPYVRKTAAVSVAKLHDINGRLVEEQGFIELLKVRTHM